MKVCCIVAEYNPLHNGHLYQIEYIKTKLQPDYIILILSGNFVERGEASVLDKYTRAKHAIMAGVDAVIELPTIFATSNAEIFCKGSTKLINSLYGDKTICFGVETQDKEGLINIAKILSNESDEFKLAIKNELDKGNTLASAKINALKKVYGNSINSEFISYPNNILAVEYTKSIISNNYNIDIYPIQRIGNGYNDKTFNKKLSSSMGIREGIILNKKHKIKNCLPKFVYNDLPKSLHNFEKQQLYALACASNEKLCKVLDCTEGLDNRIKNQIKSTSSLNELIESLTTKRYSQNRIKRIILQNMLNIESNFIKDCLKTNLYLNILAINKDKQDVLTYLSKSSYPVILRRNDIDSLTDLQLSCYNKDVFANDIYNLEVENKSKNLKNIFIDKNGIL